MYEFFFTKVLSRIDPERAHHWAFLVIRWLPVVGIGALLGRFAKPSVALRVSALGLDFPSPFGLAAGFDKDGRAVRGLAQLGFGHVEIGTITAQSQPGNPRPRLFRLIPDRAVINRMGFNNAGALAASIRLTRLARARHRPIVGINVGKSRSVDVDHSTDDYLTSVQLLKDVADYLVINVSSPNTPGLRGLQELDKLEPLLRAVVAEAGGVPVLVKISPDLTDEEIRRIAMLAVDLGLAGMIATNTTLSRDLLTTDHAIVSAAGEGGLSGAPLASRSLAVLSVIRATVPPDFCIISVGGVDTAQDVADRLEHGANLVQGYTAFLYRGPLWARSINRGLEDLLTA